MLAGCSKGEKCPSGAECITIAGGVSYCACPKGYTTKSDGSCEGKLFVKSDILLRRAQIPYLMPIVSRAMQMLIIILDVIS